MLKVKGLNPGGSYCIAYNINYFSQCNVHAWMRTILRGTQPRRITNLHFRWEVRGSSLDRSFCFSFIASAHNTRLVAAYLQEVVKSVIKRRHIKVDIRYSTNRRKENMDLKGYLLLLYNVSL